AAPRSATGRRFAEDRGKEQPMRGTSSLLSTAVVGGIVVILAACQQQPNPNKGGSGATGTGPAANQAKGSVTKSDFGKTPDGKNVELYTLKNDNGMTAKIATYGAKLTEMWVPHKSGKMADG